MENRALRTLYTFNGLFILAGSLLGPLYAVYVSNITSGVFSISLSWAVFLLSTTLFTLIMSKYGDGVKEKEHLLMAGYLIRAGGWFSYIFIQDFYTLLLVQAVLGIGEAAGTPAFDAIFAEHLDDGKHIKEYSNWKVINYATTATGVLLGGIIVDRFGFTHLFIVMSIIALIAFIGVLLKPRKLL